MANLPEQNLWENGIYQLEVTDPVVGGPPDLAQGLGIDNVPAQQLANRTVWLKALVDAHEAILSGGLDQYATDAELAAATANFITQAQMDLAIAALVDASPAALDTLNELAAALGDDPNFAATITAQLGGKLDTSAFTAAAILALIKTVDGAGSGLDADLLDNKSSSQFLRSDVATAADSTLAVKGGSVFVNATPNGNGHYYLRGSSAGVKGILTWQRNSDTIELRRYKSDGSFEALVFANGSLKYRGKEILTEGWDYESPQTTLVGNSTISFLHGLGVEPTKVAADLICVTANLGYVPGDKIIGISTTSTASSNRGVMMYIPNGSTTTLKFSMLQQIRLMSTAGAENSISLANWKLVVKASR